MNTTAWRFELLFVMAVAAAFGQQSDADAERLAHVRSERWTARLWAGTLSISPTYTARG